MTEDLRALLRAELSAEQPPPIGDIVGAAVVQGRRQRRRRRLTAAGGGALAGVLAVVVLFGAHVNLMRPGDGVLPAAGRPDPASGDQQLSGLPPQGGHQSWPPSPGEQRSVVPEGDERGAGSIQGDGQGAELPPGDKQRSGALSPGTVPITPTAAGGLPRTRTFLIHGGTPRAEGTQKKATPAAMLHLLTQLLPAGRTSRYGVASGDDLDVRLYLDQGAGPGLVRATLDRVVPGGGELPGADTVAMTIRPAPDDCLRSTEVTAWWPDGTLLELDLAGCRAGAGYRPALTPDEAVKVASDPRWGLTMDASLVDVGAARFSPVPVVDR